MKTSSILASAALIALALPQAQASRRDDRNKEVVSESAIQFNVTPPPEKPEYHILQDSLTLHREALQSFQLSEYQHARTCFSLGLKASPNASDLILNYALFSMVVPWTEGQSLKRAEGLLSQIKKDNIRKTARYHLARGILLWLKGESDSAITILKKVEHPYFTKVTQDLILHLNAGGELVNPFWAKKLLPERLDPRSKREKR
jgi:tetratricopeptide (TPR) repeat protein